MKKIRLEWECQFNGVSYSPLTRYFLHITLHRFFPFFQVALMEKTPRFQPSFEAAEADLIIMLLISMNFALPSKYPVLYHSAELKDMYENELLKDGYLFRF